MSSMKPSSVEMNKIAFSAPKTMDNGGKMIYMNYGGGIQSLYVQSPELEVPFEPSYFPDNDTGGKYAVKLSLKDHEDNQLTKEFYDKLTDIDIMIKEHALKNSVAWFKKSKMSMETIDSLYTPMVKHSLDPETGEPNGKYPPNFGFKIVKRDNKFQCKVYDKTKTVFDINNETENPSLIENVIMKGSLLKVVLKCNGIWVANGKFGCTWRAEQILVKIPEGGLDDFAIITDDEDEEETSTTRGDVNKETLLEDTTDEEQEKEEEKEETPEPEPQPEPQKVVKKRRVKKSKENDE